MADFTFLHAADLHLDSPLLGLRGRSIAWASRVDQASRQAFTGLVDLAITADCRFVVLAGDLFDGELRNFEAGLFFMEGMRRLQAAAIEVYLILGNHDAENQFAGQLLHAQNVHLFASAAPESRTCPGLPVTLHGQSFAQRDVTDNLARAYPPPVPGHFNIGLLHTACQGSEGEHAAYAPCTLPQLVNHGYDYWALGHIHARQILHEYPHVIYPGNLQGRSPRETGGKGVTLVTVADDRVVAAEHHDLDHVRWAHLRLDISAATHRDAILAQLRAELVPQAQQAERRAVALRLSLVGQSVLHDGLQLNRAALLDEVEALLASLSGNLWLERLRLRTQPPAACAGIDPSVGGRLASQIRAFAADGSAQALVERRLLELRAKIPAAAGAEHLLQALRSRAGEGALGLALSLVSDGEGPHAPD